MRFIFAFVTSALLASAPAFAADDSGFYVGAGLGTFSLQSEAISLDLEGLEIDTGRDFDGSDFAFKILRCWRVRRHLRPMIRASTSAPASARRLWRSTTFTTSA